MNGELKQDDFEGLSAWMDGELDAEQAERIAREVESDPVWGGAYRELLVLDETMDAWEAPAVPPDLTGRILGYAKARPITGARRLVRWLAPAAAAAACVIAVLLFHPTRTSPPQRRTAVLTAFPVPDSFVRGGLELFTNMQNRVTPAGKLTDLTRLRSVRLIPGSLVRVKSWRALSSGQRRRARQQALAFLRMNARRQEQILTEYEQAVNTSQHMQETWRERMCWLQAVVQSFTPQERRVLHRMLPARRARVFLQRRDQLIRAGKLPKPQSP